MTAVPREPAGVELRARRGLEAIKRWDDEHKTLINERTALWKERQTVGVRLTEAAWVLPSLLEWGRLWFTIWRIGRRLAAIGRILDPQWERYWGEWQRQNPELKPPRWRTTTA